MIKNIVFDMGRVLVDYDANAVCEKYIADEAMRKKIKTAVFVSPEWLMLDMGVISESEGLKRMQKRLDTEEEKKLAEVCFRHWHEENMWKRPGMEELIQELKRREYSLYVLSNASVRLERCSAQVIPKAELFDGMLFSATVLYLKPQQDIYRVFCEKFKLNPEECLFIDDMPENIEAAVKFGMEGYCFEDQDTERLKERLLAL